MNAADLDRRVTLQRATITRGASGSKIETYGTLVEVWAKFTYQPQGKEGETSGLLESVQRVFIRIRYLAGLTTSDRVQYKGTTFDIISIRETARLEFLDLLCEERGKVTAQ
jgi:SPP1 family predicted phage head-tail adaptor